MVEKLSKSTKHSCSKIVLGTYFEQESKTNRHKNDCLKEEVFYYTDNPLKIGDCAMLYHAVQGHKGSTRWDSRGGGGNCRQELLFQLYRKEWQKQAVQTYDWTSWNHLVLLSSALQGWFPVVQYPVLWWLGQKTVSQTEEAWEKEIGGRCGLHIKTMLASKLLVSLGIS